MAEEGPVVFTRRASGLVREVGIFTAMAIGLTHTIGGGINNYMVQMPYSAPGSNVPAAFAIAGLFTLFTAVSYSMLGVAMPRTGGDYIYISRSINPVLGFVTSWGFWLTELLSLGIIAYIDIPFWGTAFRIYGSASGSESAFDTATTLSENQGVILTLAIIICIVSALVTYLGTRVYSWIINIGLVAGILGSIAMVAYFLIRTGQPYNELWNSVYGAGTYEKIMNNPDAIAAWSGVTKGMGATLQASIVCVWAYIGFTAAAYMGGEVKNPTKGMIWAVTGAAALIIAYYLLLSFLVYGKVGDEFLYKYNYMFNNQLDTLKTYIRNPSGPILPAFACALTTNHSVQMLIAVSGAIWLLNDIPAFFLVCSRLVFSWSFDRFFPEKFAEVNDRFHSPHYAILLTMFGGFFGVWMAYGNTWVAALDTTFLYIFAIMFGCLSAAVLPYIRRDIYEKSPSIEIGGVPLMTIAGVLGFTGNFFLLLNAAVGMVADLSNAFFECCWMGIGVILFVAFWNYNRKRGVDTSKIYAEIPPA